LPETEGQESGAQSTEGSKNDNERDDPKHNTTGDPERIQRAATTSDFGGLAGVQGLSHRNSESSAERPYRHSADAPRSQFIEGGKHAATKGDAEPMKQSPRRKVQNWLQSARLPVARPNSLSRSRTLLGLRRKGTDSEVLEPLPKLLDSEDGR
jgi:hypothetical protein